MTENKHFVIDVADEIYENAFFEDGKFVCLEDDFDEILKKFNELADENEQLRKALNYSKKFILNNNSKILCTEYLKSLQKVIRND